jgi:hypothetical protein
MKRSPAIMRSVIAILLAIVAGPVFAQLAPPFPYPEPAPESVVKNIHGSLELGYLATSKVYRYVADVNVGFDFGSWRGAKFNFGGGILTLVRSGSGDDFQPDRYRGTIEPAIYLPKGRSAYIFSIRHQSFHSIDKPSDGKESYELYNAAYQHAGPPNIRIAIGKYINRKHVDYNWEVLAQVDTACLGYCKFGKFYVSGLAHYVKESSDSLSGRDSFTDVSLEAGIESKSAIRYFVALRQIHDIDRFLGTTDNQVLIGTKILW